MTRYEAFEDELATLDRLHKDATTGVEPILAAIKRELGHNLSAKRIQDARDLWEEAISDLLFAVRDDIEREMEECAPDEAGEHRREYLAGVV